LAEQFGARLIIGGFFCLSTVATLLTPVAARIGVGLLIVVRILCGIGTVCFHFCCDDNSKCTRWALLQLRAKRWSVYVYNSNHRLECCWWGFTTTDDRHCIKAVVLRGVRAGLYPADGPTAAQLVEDYDDTLFSHLMNSEQLVLHQLPAQSDHYYNLRPRPHNLSLSYAIDHRNFIPRLTFKDTYY